MATRERTAADQHLGRPYEIVLTRRDSDDGKEWVAHVTELPGCEVRATSDEDALAEVHVAMQTWIEDAVANDRTVPPPKAENSHSGRLLVRMPPTLHADLARVADGEKVSLNTLIVGILGGATAWPHGDRPAIQRDAPDMAAAGGSPEDPRVERRQHLASMALMVNVAVVVVVGLLAVGLLIATLAG